MGIKTTIDSRGVISEEVVGDSTFGVTLKQTVHPVQNYSFNNTNVTLSSNKFTVICPTSSLGITASLPVIAVATLGKEFCLMTGTGSNDQILVTASNGIRPGSTWTLTYSGSHATIGFMAVSSSIGYYWHTTNKVNVVWFG